MLFLKTKTYIYTFLKTKTKPGELTRNSKTGFVGKMTLSEVKRNSK